VIVARTKSAEDTQALAAELAALARPGDLVVLAGDLGAGKTAFAKGFGRALGVTVPITSPTFTLVRGYEGGRLPVLHVDVYRLDHLQEALDLGLAELLDDGAVAVVEWGDMVEAVLPADFLEVRIEFGGGDDDRILRVRVVGPSWAARTSAIGRALERWSDGSDGGGGC
jgi:tRNA threonylcarbamoyladenosine biosynthesis protein TsaE